MINREILRVYRWLERRNPGEAEWRAAAGGGERAICGGPSLPVEDVMEGGRGSGGGRARICRCTVRTDMPPPELLPNRFLTLSVLLCWRNLNQSRPAAVVKDEAALIKLVGMLRLEHAASDDALAEVESLATFIATVANTTARGAGFLARAGAAEQLVECWATAGPRAASTSHAISRALLAVCTHAADITVVLRLLSLVAQVDAPAQAQVLQVLQQMYEKGASSGWVGAAPSACLDLRGSDTAPGPGQEQAVRNGWLERGDHASLALPVLEQWPTDGYTVVSWFRIEQRAASGAHTSAAHLPLLTFSSG
eukprot:COSAG02_NODE_1661_length_11445_cov_70.751983_8_plen_309_part_00